MIRWAALIVALLAAAPAGAQCLGFQCPPGVLGAGTSGAPAPLDGFTTPAGAYSFRKLRSAYAGNAVKLRRVDAATQDIGFQGNDFDLAAATAFCTTACTIDTWYDQSGNGRNTGNGTPAAQPLYIANCLGVNPCAEAGPTVSGLASLPQAWAGKTTISVVAVRTSGTGQCYFATKGNNILVAQGATANSWYMSDQAVMAYAIPATNAAWHTGVATMDGVASAARVDTTDYAGANVPGSTASASISLIVGTAATTCRLAEAVVWDNYATTQPERVSLTANQTAYWVPYTLDTFTTPVGAYSMRKLKSTYAGPGIRLRRASDNAETDINFLGYTSFTGAPIDTAAANAHCAATSCFVTAMYDQSGNGRNFTPPAPPNQPQYVADCGNGKPCARMTLGNAQYLGFISLATVSPLSVSAVSRVVSRGTGGCRPVYINNNTLEAHPSTDFATLSNGTLAFSAAATTLNWHSYTGVINGAASVLRVDAAETTGNVTVLTPPISSVFQGGAGATCDQVEWIQWNGYALTAAERAALAGNQQGYWVP